MRKVDEVLVELVKIPERSNHIQHERLDSTSLLAQNVGINPDPQTVLLNSSTPAYLRRSVATKPLAV
jgi:hypothetical protein